MGLFFVAIKLVQDVTYIPFIYIVSYFEIFYKSTWENSNIIFYEYKKIKIYLYEYR